MEKNLEGKQTQIKTTQPQKSEFTFPTEEVTLPSKGLLYAADSPLRSGKITMKYMTAKEEDILTNQNFIKNGTVIDKLLQSLIVDGTSINDILVGDKNALLVASRILGYGADYSFKYQNPETGEEVLPEVKEGQILTMDGKIFHKSPRNFTNTRKTVISFNITIR